MKGSKYYDDIYRDSIRYRLPYYNSNYYKVWQKVCEWINRGDNIADIGCGPGQFADMLFARFEDKIKYTGVDFSGVAIKTARELVPGYNFRWSDAKEYINKDPEYDLIILLEFLEHVDNDLDIMGLIPEGKRVIFSVPSYDSEAHVRTFAIQDEIFERYGDLINIDEAYRFNFTETRFITLVKGVR